VDAAPGSGGLEGVALSLLALLLFGLVLDLLGGFLGLLFFFALFGVEDTVDVLRVNALLLLLLEHQLPHAVLLFVLDVLALRVTQFLVEFDLVFLQFTFILPLDVFLVESVLVATFVFLAFLFVIGLCHSKEL